MKSTIALSTLLLCGNAFAAPSLEQRSEVARRSGRSGLLKLDHSTSESIAQVESADTANVVYSNNWGGAIQNDNGITQVSAVVNVPSASASGSGLYGGSAWVGIDGSSCSSAILQTGVTWEVQNGKTTYSAWYEWWPADSFNFNLAINEGDSISMKVVASSKTGGTAYLTNLSTGKSVSHVFTGQSHALCETNAEWIVEDFNENGSEIPFAKFSTVTFTNASYLANGKTKGVSGSTISDIRENGNVLTDCKTSGSSTVQCSYV